MMQGTLEGSWGTALRHPVFNEQFAPVAELEVLCYPGRNHYSMAGVESYPYPVEN